VTAGAYSEVDVSSLFAAGPRVSLALTTPSSTWLSLSSRESGADALKLATADVTAPTAPGGLTAAAAGSGSIDLTWRAATAVGIAS